jgi:hypothetical protein
MRKTILGLAAAAMVAAGAVAVPPKAEAAAWWVVPAIVGGVLVGGVVVATAASQPYAYEPGGAVYVRPTAAPGSCRIMRERVPGGWRRVQVCY